jgi:transcriptional regulator
MFVRPCWRPRTGEELFQLIDSDPWALLVNNGPDGPIATNMPLLLDRSRGEHGTLIGHVARANEHARALQISEAPTLAIFEGPYQFVTGSWYPNRDMPSTYYYTAVHCYGRVRIQKERELEQWIGILTGRMEAQFPNGWKITDVPHADISRRLPAIMGFEIELSRVEGKFKLGQDESKRDAMAVYHQLAQSSNPTDRALAEMVRDYNAGRDE